MEDFKIIELFWQRKESAITETARKYGHFCHRIAMNILTVQEDAEECVNDSYHTVWNRIPPTKPDSFKAFLGRIVRNLSISRYRKNRAQKRYNGIELLLSELEDCIPSADPVEAAIEQRHLSALLSDWLESLSAEDRSLFIRRYWFGDELQRLAKENRITPNALAQRMLKLRQQLRAKLEQEGVSL